MLFSTFLFLTRNSAESERYCIVQCSNPQKVNVTVGLSITLAFSWIFVSRSVMGCREDSRGLRERGMEQAWGWGGTPRLRLDRGVGRPPGVGREAPQSEGVLEPFLDLKGWASCSGSGQGAEGLWEPRASAPSGQCVCRSP